MNELLALLQQNEVQMTGKLSMGKLICVLRKGEAWTVFSIPTSEQNWPVSNLIDNYFQPAIDALKRIAA
jgi:hypothetical protein